MHKKNKKNESYLWVATQPENIWHPLNRSDKQNYDNRQFLQTKQIETKKIKNKTGQWELYINRNEITYTIEIFNYTTSVR